MLRSHKASQNVTFFLKLSIYAGVKNFYSDAGNTVMKWHIKSRREPLLERGLRFIMAENSGPESMFRQGQGEQTTTVLEVNKGAYFLQISL